MDGEMVLLDGHIYQLKSSGNVHEASDDEELPFVMVTRLEPTAAFTVKGLESKEQLHEKLAEVFPESGNLFLAYRVEAKRGRGWVRLKVRTVGGQQYKGH